MTGKPSKHPDKSNTPAAPDGQTLQGWIPDPADRKELLDALNKAFDYRGDVTITRADGSTLEGYIFDRRTGQGLDDSYVRVMPIDSDARVEVRYADIARLEFTGKDTAAGKSFENWIKRYVEKKRAGEKASIESESLD